MTEATYRGAEFQQAKQPSDHPKLRRRMHFVSADLHLEDRTFVKNGGMDRLVAVLFRDCNIILEARTEMLEI